MKPLGWFPLVALTACTAGSPPHQEPALEVEVPDRWSAGSSSDEAIRAGWWGTFEDERIGELIAESLAYNYDLRVAAARVEAAAAQAVIAGAPVYPTLDLGLDAARQRQNFVGFPFSGAGNGPPAVTFNRFGVSLGTSWELDLWGRVSAGHEAAIAGLEAATEDWAALRESLAAQTVKAYLATVEAVLQVRLAQDTVVSFTETAGLVHDRFVSGVRPALDFRLARNDLASSQARLEAQRERFERASRQLELLLGRYPKGEIDAADDMPGVPERAPAGLPADLVRRRPDVRAVERRLAGSVSRVDEARASLFPRISLTASGGTATEEFEDLLDSDFFVWSLAGNLVQPILSGGRLRAEVELAEARSREAVAVYANAALRAYSEVETALAVEVILRRRVEQLGLAEQEARAAWSLAEERYRGGLEDILTVLQSKRRVATAASQKILVRRMILDARVDLHLALGGGFDQPFASGGER